MTEHRGLDHKGVERDCIQEVHFCDAYDPPADSESERLTGSLLGRPLSNREWAILRGYMGGGNSTTIAADLSVSPKTVEAHSKSLRAKLGAKTITQAVANYFRGWR